MCLQTEQVISVIDSLTKKNVENQLLYTGNQKLTKQNPLLSVVGLAYLQLDMFAYFFAQTTLVKQQTMDHVLNN